MGREKPNLSPSIYDTMRNLTIATPLFITVIVKKVQMESSPFRGKTNPRCVENPASFCEGKKKREKTKKSLIFRPFIDRWEDSREPTVPGNVVFG